MKKRKSQHQQLLTPISNHSFFMESQNYESQKTKFNNNVKRLLKKLTHQEKSVEKIESRLENLKNLLYDNKKLIDKELKDYIRNWKTEYNDRLLYVVIHYGDPNFFKFLIKAISFDINKPIQIYNRSTALHHLCIINNVELIKFSIEKGALNLKDRSSRTPLHWNQELIVSLKHELEKKKQNWKIKHPKDAKKITNKIMRYKKTQEYLNNVSFV